MTERVCVIRDNDELAGSAQPRRATTTGCIAGTIITPRQTLLYVIVQVELKMRDWKTRERIGCGKPIKPKQQTLFIRPTLI